MVVEEKYIEGAYQQQVKNGDNVIENSEWIKAEHVKPIPLNQMV